MQENGGANIAMASRFSLAGCIICLFDPLLSLVYFRRLKYILARKMRQNARQSDTNK